MSELSSSSQEKASDAAAESKDESAAAAAAAPAAAETSEREKRSRTRTRNRRKLMWQLPLLMVLFFAVIWTFGTLFGRHVFLYHPTSLSEQELLHLVAGEADWTVDTTSFMVAERKGKEPHERSAVGLMRYGAPGEPWILYFGGNAQDLGSSRRVLDKMIGERAWGAAVWAYRGYDGTPGTPTERRLVADGIALARALMHRHSIEPQRLIIVGQSLGSGVATQVAKGLAAAQTPVAGLVLVSPFRSIPAVGNDHFIWPLGHAMPDKYDNERHLPDTVAPVLIVHGTKDRVIPYRHGKALHEATKPRSELVTLEGLDHNDLWFTSRTAESVQRFIERHTQP